MLLRVVLPMVVLLIVALAWGRVGYAHDEEHTQDKLEQVMAALKAQKAVLIDVREKSEWDKGHLKDAKLVPLSTLKGPITAEALRKSIAPNRIVYLHCASGYRCLDAAAVLRKYGYEVRALSAGYKQLLQAGFTQAPADKPEADKSAPQ